MRNVPEAMRPEQDDGADDRCDQAAQRPDGDQPQQRQNPAAQNTADDADDQIDDEPRTVSFDQKIGQPSGDEPDKQIPEKNT